VEVKKCWWREHLPFTSLNMLKERNKKFQITSRGTKDVLKYKSKIISKIY